MMKQKISWTHDEEEEIESETEEDRVFIDDDVEEQGASFYRALDREQEDQSENDHECAYDKPEDNSAEPKKKKVHPLEKVSFPKIPARTSCPGLQFW